VWYYIAVKITNIKLLTISSTQQSRIQCHSYLENVRLSHFYCDQPLTPLQHTVYWTEYVIRYEGAPPLRSAVLDRTWYQYFLLDVIAVLALTFGAASTVPSFIFRAILGNCAVVHQDQ